MTGITERLFAKFSAYTSQEPELPSLAGFYSFDTDFFVEHSTGRDVRSNWLKTFKAILKESRIEKYAKDEPDWSKIIQSKTNPICQPSSGTVPKSKSSSLKSTITANEKAQLRATFDSLDKTRFWVLESTRKAAAEKQVKPASVDERVIDFALSCNFHHPSQSLILDLTDSNWDGIFTDEERIEIYTFGHPLLRPINEELARKMDELKDMKSAREAFDFARKIDYDPEEQPMLAWLSLTLQNTAMMFLKKNDYNIQDYLESDKLYYLWSFVNTIFNVSKNIAALGKEKSSTANASVVNRKRKISAVDAIEPLKMGRRTDTVYLANHDIELGCLEIGKNIDQTKEWSDGLAKMPVVMRDMLMRMAEESPTLIKQIRILGYSINGNKMSLLEMDVPEGYVTRVRRSKPSMYPNDKENFVVRMVPLLELAAIGLQIAEDTFEIFSNTMIPLSSSIASPNPVLPPRSFVPKSAFTSISSDTSSSTSSNTSSSTPNKKPNTEN